MTLSVYDIIQGIHQAAANGWDGAWDENYEPVKIGLKREEGDTVLDRRIMDGFKVGIAGNVLKVSYSSEMGLREVHGTDFEGETLDRIKDIVKFLKKEYKKLTKESLSLTEVGESNVFVQRMSNYRTWVEAQCFYKIGGIADVEKMPETVDKRLTDAMKKWIGFGNKEKD